MRQVHIRIVAVTAVLAVVIGVAAAFLVGRDTPAPAQPAAAATPSVTANASQGDTATQGETAAKGGTAPAGGTSGSSGKAQPSREQAAKATAVAFMRELRMPQPVAASYRETGMASAEVGIHPRLGEGGRVLDGPTTIVQLHRYHNGWVATGAKAVNQIEVDEPLPFSRIQSPVTVSGTSVAYEGTVHVTVTEDRQGQDRVLGKGFVNGGADQLAPFRGAIKFALPTPGIDAGWVVFSPDTGIDTPLISATAVRVQFVNSDHKPQILSVFTNPPATGSAKLVTLSGSGTMGIMVNAFAANEVRFLLVPSGTGGRSHAKLLGVDNTANADGEHWNISWRYPDEPFHGHLLIQANGRGGTTEWDDIAVLHN